MHTTPPDDRAPFVNAYSTRGGRTAQLHASHRAPIPAGANTYRVLCGRTARNVTTTDWDPRGPGRRCVECVNESIRRDR